MRITALFKEFIDNEKSAGLILIICTLVSLSITNFILGDSYIELWHTHIGGLSLEHWINDGLMAIFFLLIGLELVRELSIGELSNPKEASLPMFAALGGMIVPFGLYVLVNKGHETVSGAGIPMATDIAFALGILSILGNRIPIALKVFLTALAVIDDLGAIVIIALFYTGDIHWNYLFLSFGIVLILFILNRKKVCQTSPYIVGGSFLWFTMFKSGIHPTIAGVIVAFLIPFGNGSKNSPSYKLQHDLHKPVAFFILPLFALSNTAFFISSFSGGVQDNLASLGIMLGLIIGKPLGIGIFSWFAIRQKWSKIPRGVNWKLLIGTGFLGGIGFTMSIFISLLAFNDILLINQAKFAILLSSLIAGLFGYFILNHYSKKIKE